MEKNNYYSIEGKLFIKRDEVAVSDKFKKREFILAVTNEYDGKTYTKFITFQFIQDACDKLNYVDVNDTVEVWFTLDGRKWEVTDKVTKEKTGEVKYFNTIKATSIQSKQIRAETTPENTSSQEVNNFANQSSQDGEDPLPF